MIYFNLRKDAYFRPQKWRYAFFIAKIQADTHFCCQNTGYMYFQSWQICISKAARYVFPKLADMHLYVRKGRKR